MKGVKDIYPLSPMQRGMLFHALYAPGEGSYVEQVSYRLEGELDQAAFVEAWKVVLSHHDVLRTAFLWEGLDAPVQVVRTTAAPSYVFQDWQGETEDRLQQHLADFLSHDRRRSFDLACAPLTRFMLARTGPRTHYLVWTFHHLVLDGWSIPLVLRDLFTAYSALCTGAAPVLPRARPFSDYIAWLQEQPEHEAMAFWAENFNGYAATATTVPMPGTPAPAADGEEYAETSFRIPAAATSQLETFARQQQLTLNTLLLGAWSLLLGRYTDSEDVVVGSTVSGRSPNLQGGGAMVGMFVNTLPVRARMDANRPVADWLRQLQKQLLDAREYEHCPLVQIQAWGGVPRGAALFDSIIAFQNQPISEVLGHLESAVRVLPLVDRHTRTAYPLTLMIEPGESMSVTVVYDTRRFGKDDLTRISGHLQTLLSSIASDPQRPLGELQMITAAEREAQLRSRAGPALAVPATAGLVHQLFEAQVAARPQAVALVEGTQVLRYGELNAQANRLAHYLIGQGVRPDDRVGVCLERGIALVVALLGILKAGGAYVPLDPGYPPDRLGYMLADSAPRCVLTQAAVQTVLPASVPVIALDQAGLLDGQPVHDPDPQALGLTPQHLAYVIYTSGSTGRPKGVMNQHDGVVNRLLWAQEQFALDASDRVLQKTPFGFDVSVWEFFLPLLAGAQLVLARPGGHQDPHYLAGLMASAGITVLHFVPSMLQVFLDEADTSGCGGVRQILCSGEALPAALQNRLLERLPQVALYNLYGPTEAAVDVTCWRCQPGSATVPIGRPIANTQIHIVDRYLQPVPIGVAGELLIGGVQVARGYLNQPQLTAERFIEDPFHPGGRVYRSGDLARWRQDGTIDYLGRNDDQVKLRGQRIELGEVQSQLQQLPHVRDAVVVAREDRAGDPRLVAYVVTVPGVELTVSTVREALARTLTEAMLPSAVVSLPALPLTPNGKLDRQALPVPGMESLAARAYEPPREGMEQALAQLWCELLDVARVGRADHFFDLGGNSLIAIQLLGRIRVDMVVDISLRDLFDNPELQSLAAFIAAAQLQTFLGDELAAMEAELAGLSTEELDRLLTDESK